MSELLKYQTRIMKAEEPIRWRLSILQLMKVVVYAAVAFACVASMVEPWQMGVLGGGARGLLGLIVFELTVVPLVWALLSFVLVRPGAGRDALVAGFLLVSILAALGFACWSFLLYHLPAYLNSSANVGIASVAFHFLVIVVLAAAAILLPFRLAVHIARLLSRPG